MISMRQYEMNNKKCSQVIVTTKDSRKWENLRPKRLYCHFRCRSLWQSPEGTFFEVGELAWSKTPNLPLEFWLYTSRF